MATWQQPHLPGPARAKAESIRLLALDVDGVMTDGTLLFSANGDELKGFNILDGLGLKQVMGAGIEVAVITGRQSPLTQKRMSDLGITHLLQGREDKKIALQEIMATLNLSASEVAYVGDDLPDLPAILFAGLGVTVPNGHWCVRARADWCTTTRGGHGAVREVCDALLSAQGKLENALAPYLPEH